MSDPKEESILIVDDDELNRAILSNIFCEEYSILEAEDGQAGLAAVRAHPHAVSAILLDVVMPRLTASKRCGSCTGMG